MSTSPGTSSDASASSRGTADEASPETRRASISTIDTAIKSTWSRSARKIDLVVGPLAGKVEQPVVPNAESTNVKTDVREPTRTPRARTEYIKDTPRDFGSTKRVWTKRARDQDRAA